MRDGAAGCEQKGQDRTEGARLEKAQDLKDEGWDTRRVTTKILDTQVISRMKTVTPQGQFLTIAHPDSDYTYLL